MLPIPCVWTPYIVMAYIVMAYIVMARNVADPLRVARAMVRKARHRHAAAHIVMAYTVMAYLYGRHVSQPFGKFSSRRH